MGEGPFFLIMTTAEIYQLGTEHDFKSTLSAYKRMLFYAKVRPLDIQEHVSQIRKNNPKGNDQRHFVNRMAGILDRFYPHNVHEPIVVFEGTKSV